MSPVTGLAKLVGQILFSIHMENFSSVTKMNKVRTFKFHPDNQAAVLTWENLQPGYQDLSHKNQDLNNWASPPSQINTQM